MLFFDDLTNVLRVFIATPIIYFVLIAFLRIAGKRSLASLNAFDLLVTVALGSLLASTAVSANVPLAEGAVAMAVLLGLQWVVTRSSVASDKVRKLVRASPRYLVRDGHFCEQAASDERVTKAEVEEAMRKHGYGRFEKVAALVLETDGSFSVLGKDDGHPDAVSEVRA